MASSVLLQKAGIGMGPPGSPPYCMAVCIYYEKQFLDSVYDHDRFTCLVRDFDGVRFLVAINSADSTSEASLAQLINDLQTKCYHPSLELLLEESSQSSLDFLECTIQFVCLMQIDLDPFSRQRIKSA